MEGRRANCEICDASAVDHLVNNASIWQVCKFEEVEDVNHFRTLMVRVVVDTQFTELFHNNTTASTSFRPIKETLPVLLRGIRI